MNKKGSIKFSFIRGLVAILIALAVSYLLILMSNGGSFSDALDSLRYMLVQPVMKKNGFNSKGLTDIMALMVPTMFTGLATCMMFSANQFNLGSEGGIMLGAFVGALVAIYCPVPAPFLQIAAIGAAAGVVAAVLWLPAFLKAKFGISEMVNSLMMNYVIMYVIRFLLNTFFADTSKGAVQTKNFREGSALPLLINNGSGLSVGFIIAIATVIFVWFLMYRTKLGYGIRMVGINQQFTRYSGLNVVLIVILCQVIGGALAGGGGAIEMLGRNSYYNWQQQPGYGWDGITVAILAGNNPAYVPLAAFFMAYLNKGCEMMSVYTGVPAQLIDIIQAVIFLFFAAKEFLARYRQRLVVKSAEEESAALQKAGKEGGES